MYSEEYSKRVRGDGIKFDRLRRITGYLVGSLDRWNNGKLAEEQDRVKHSTSIEPVDKEECAYENKSVRC